MQAKNEALAAAGAIVPTSFEAFEGTIRDTFARMVAEGAITPRPDVDAPSVPQDLEAAKKAGKVGPQTLNTINYVPIRVWRDGRYTKHGRAQRAAGPGGCEGGWQGVLHVKGGRLFRARFRFKV